MLIFVFCEGVVALRKESVDRNNGADQLIKSSIFVALRKESVDRNHITLFRQTNICVALRKESVDRNPMQKSLVFVTLSRSPQGERG